MKDLMATASDIIPIKWQKLNPNARIPQTMSIGAACFDLCAALDQDLVLKPGDIVGVPTGLAVEVPLGFELQVRARSGLAIKNGFTLVNGVGTIDADYRGEIKVIATILGKEPLTIKNGDRIAQALVSRLVPVQHLESEELSSTERGVQGFGSTGV